MLGRAGLLDGYRCTTHWNYVERLAQAFPDARVETEHIYVMDRDLITSGGITAGIDLALAIVAEDHGKALALEVAKVLLVARHRQGGQTPYGPLLAAVPGMARRLPGSRLTSSITSISHSRCRRWRTWWP